MVLLAWDVVNSICQWRHQICSKIWFNYPLGSKLPASVLLHLNDIFPPYNQASYAMYWLLCKATGGQRKVKMLLAECIPTTPEHHVLLNDEKQKQNSPRYLYLPNKRARLRRRTRLENKREEETPGGRWQMVHQVDLDSPQNWPN